MSSKALHMRRLQLAGLGILLAALLVSGCTALFKPAPSPLASSGAPYTVNGDTVTGAYPDEDGRQLTDGFVGSGSFQDARWVGIHGPGSHELVMDLGADKLVFLVRLHLLQDLNAAIDYPDTLELSVSPDGAAWSSPMVVSTADLVGATGPSWIAFPEVVERGRYVRIRLDTDAEWTFVSEIEVYTM